MASLSVLLARQEVPAFSCILLIDLLRFLREEVSWDAKHYGEPKMSLVPVILTKQEVPAFSCM